MKQVITLILSIFFHLSIFAVTQVSINNAETWKNSELRKYVGQTVEFDVPFYVCNNYRGSYTISPRRIFQPTNQALPLSDEYDSMLSLNAQGTITLSGVKEYHRLGERLHKLTARIDSYNKATLVSCEWRGNTRAEVERGYDSVAVNMRK